jgi:hypothetical protein
MLLGMITFEEAQKWHRRFTWDDRITPGAARISVDVSGSGLYQALGSAVALQKNQGKIPQVILIPWAWAALLSEFSHEHFSKGGRLKDLTLCYSDYDPLLWGYFALFQGIDVFASHLVSSRQFPACVCASRDPHQMNEGENLVILEEAT